jgi:hypothetical protein
MGHPDAPERAVHQADLTLEWKWCGNGAETVGTHRCDSAMRMPKVCAAMQPARDRRAELPN